MKKFITTLTAIALISMPLSGMAKKPDNTDDFYPYGNDAPTIGFCIPTPLGAWCFLY